jgi:hypothetical protein
MPSFRILVVDESVDVGGLLDRAVSSAVVHEGDAAHGGAALECVLRDLVWRTMNRLDVPVEAAGDPIESWMGEADATLGFMAKQWRSRDAEQRAMRDFARDVSSLREQPAREPLAIKPSQNS